MTARSLAPVEPLTRLQDAGLRAVRDALAGAGYTPEVLGRAEHVAPGQLDRVRLPLVQLTLEAERSPGADLTRLFAYDDVLPETRLAGVLGGDARDALRRGGILGPVPGRPGHLAARFRLLPVQDLWLLADDPAAGGDCVMGPGPTTLQLLNTLPDPSGKSFLDLGCGAGTLALAAARRGASAATGTDVNPRATELAGVNARLNGIRAEFLAGDLLDPVAGRRFDLVASQPPYVIQAGGTEAVTYLHGGPRGDAVTARLIAALPGALAPGGRALVSFEAVLDPDEQLHARVQEWLGDDGLDLVVLTAPGAPPDLQAANYASLEDPTLGPAYSEAARRMLIHLRDLGPAEFVRALVLIRAGGPGRPAGDLRVQLPVSGHGGRNPESLDRLLAGLDLALAPDAALLDARVRPARGARWIAERTGLEPGAPGRMTVRFPPDRIGVDGELNRNSAALLNLLADGPTVAEALGRYAEGAGCAEEEVRGSVLGFVRNGLGRGLLEPAD